MEDEGIFRLLIESGLPENQFLDDQPKNFKANPFFLYLCPQDSPGHLIDLQLGEDKPTLYFYQPNDFWHEVSTLENAYWEDFFDIKIVTAYNDIWDDLGPLDSQISYISPSPKMAIDRGAIEVGDRILAKMSWLRTFKTEYEINCISEANKIAAEGHRAAETSFLKGASEFEIYNSFLQATHQREFELPYGAIVALDQNAAVLHYQFPKHQRDGKVFLIDAGARINGYCSDITRTYATKNAHPIFRDILERMNHEQKELCKLVRPGVDYVSVHRKAYENVADILIDYKIFSGSRDECLEKQIPLTFFPHGIGHPLGIQVHDVAGKQSNAEGDIPDQPEEFPYLRTLRTIQENDVMTIEPGLYFIPMLLNELKNKEDLRADIDWNLIDELIPMGGIRIEDNVVAGKDQAINLTRKYLP